MKLEKFILKKEFKSIILNATPLIDVRSPLEFEKGSFPNSINLPILNNKERHEIGICYKKKGNEEAIKLGYKLVSGEVKEERIKLWLDFIKNNPNAHLFCFRGGQRSKISQEWINDSGKEIKRLKGGYKAFRNFLMNEIEVSCNYFKPIILGGYTGSGKTILLKSLENSIDLEKLANHSGSSFGRKITPQPSQINFENSLAYELILKLDKGFKHLIFEDEGKRIGGIYIPPIFSQYLCEAPLVILETSMNERVEITFKEYVIDSQKKYKDIFVWRDEIFGSLDRIKKRLGNKRYCEVRAIFENAFSEQIKSGLAEAHKEWIEYLLKEYYDPMYDYQIQKKSNKIEFKGSKEEIVEFFSNRDF